MDLSWGFIGKIYIVFFFINVGPGAPSWLRKLSNEVMLLWMMYSNDILYRLRLHCSWLRVLVVIFFISCSYG